MRFEKLEELSLEKLGVDADALDGPFLMGSGDFGFLLSFRGKHGGSMPSCSEIHWGRDVPAAMKEKPVYVFFRRRRDAVYLGPAHLVRRGKPSKDGYMFAYGLVDPIDEGAWQGFMAEASAPPPPAPEAAIADLGPSSTTSHRVAAMKTFIDRWHGPALGESEPDGGVMPQPLRAFYKLTQGREVCFQNSIPRPQELEVEDERLIFYVENQGVCVWSTEPTGGDPPVYVRGNEANAPWRKESESISEFLLSVLIYEAIFGAPFTARHDGLDGRGFSKLKRHVRPLPLSPWLSSKVRFYGSSGVIGFAHSEAEGRSVAIGAKDEVRMDPLKDLVAEWPEVAL